MTLKRTTCRQKRHPELPVSAQLAKGRQQSGLSVEKEEKQINYSTTWFHEDNPCSWETASLFSALQPEGCEAPRPSPVGDWGEHTVTGHQLGATRLVRELNNLARTVDDRCEKLLTGTRLGFYVIASSESIWVLEHTKLAGSSLPCEGCCYIR
ncbi:hypothetical protein MN608_01789 [Microdochium nivale]|nr:hypothetical protein MN608_01789 [Microdochium nivale]